jgi:hypothetical protein
MSMADSEATSYFVSSSWSCMSIYYILYCYVAVFYHKRPSQQSSLSVHPFNHCGMVYYNQLCLCALNYKGVLRNVEIIKWCVISVLFIYLFKKLTVGG